MFLNHFTHCFAFNYSNKIVKSFRVARNLCYLIIYFIFYWYIWLPPGFTPVNQVPANPSQV